MTIVLDLPHDLESELSAEASKAGMSLTDYALRVFAALQLPRSSTPQGEWVNAKQPARVASTQAENEPQFVVLSVDEFERLNRQKKRLMLREEYLRMLINEGHTTEDLQQLLLELDASDEAWLANREAEQGELFRFTENRFQRYCSEQGIDYSSLNDESFSHVVDRMLQTVRSNADTVKNCG